MAENEQLASNNKKIMTEWTLIKQEQKESHSYLLLGLSAPWDKDDVTMVVAAALAVEEVSLLLRLQADSTNGLTVGAAPPSAAGGASADRLPNHLHHAMAHI